TGAVVPARRPAALRANGWADVAHRLALPNMEAKQVTFRVERENVPFEVTLSTTEDPESPIGDRGLAHLPETFSQGAEDPVEALMIGASRAWGFWRTTLESLNAYLLDRIAPDNVGAPMSVIAVAAMPHGGEMILFVTLRWLIGVNMLLIVANLLPLPG